ncbi:LGFP repeat-containing protein, partial [Propionibacterium sp.]|uniref:LGFP repeat-containing protein n=1 Tax=Propionibacterium sp. TaxID=1977903 RepID=UPI0039EA98F0
MGEATKVADGITQKFQHGVMYWSQQTGAAAVHGANLDEYISLGGPISQLGWPLANEQPLAGGVYQDFQGGKIYWSANSGAHAVTSAFLVKYAALNWQLGTLGWPTGDFTSLTGGGSQQFQGGTLYTSANGTFSVHGGIRDTYVNEGSRNGALGFPTSDEVPAARGGAYQNFQGGIIYWTPGVGAYTIHGAIHDEWASLGADKSYLGYPTSNEIPSTDGRVYQNFQGGTIYWAPGVGAYTIHGAIHDEWASLGADNSYLGYPTSNEIGTVNGGTFQNYQGGTI